MYAYDVELVEYLKEQALYIEVMGKQEVASRPAPHRRKSHGAKHDEAQNKMVPFFIYLSVFVARRRTAIHATISWRFCGCVNQ